MRVVHIVSSLRGGAGIAARRLSEALNAMGVESAIVCRSGAPDAPDAVAVDGSSLAAAERFAWLFEDAVQATYITPNRSDLSNTLFTLDYAGLPIAQREAVTTADVINLHWTSFFQSTETLADLFALGKPIIWTLHDMNPFTGGCHYSAGCTRFTETCAQCPQLSGDPAGAAAARLAERKALYDKVTNLAVVAPSVWLASEVQRSAAFSRAYVETIMNCVDSVVFHPRGRAAARQKLGVADKTVCIGFAPLNRAERRKGFAKLEAALSILAARTKNSDLRLVVLGEGADTAKFAFPTIGVAAAEREASVAAVLSACDICVTPSLEDNLPNTILEAMACSVPVVAFDVGGAKDAIVDGESGVLVAVGDSAALAEQLAELVSDSGKRQAMGQAARRRAEEVFAPKRQAAAYVALYQRLAKTAPVSRPVSTQLLSEHVPVGVLAAAWPTFMAYAAKVHQDALDQIERTRNWAEKTEHNLSTALERVAGAEDWAKRSDQALQRQTALAKEYEQWARKNEAALQEKARTIAELEAWAHRSEAALRKKGTLVAELEAMARGFEARLKQQAELTSEFEEWARRNDAALQEKNALAKELETWAHRSEARLKEKNTQLDTLRARLEAAENRAREVAEREQTLNFEIAGLKALLTATETKLAETNAKLDHTLSRTLRRFLNGEKGPRD